MLYSFGIIVGFDNSKMLIAALTIGFNPHLLKLLEGHVDCLHPLNYWLKTSKPLFIFIANRGFLLCTGQAASSWPWEACNHLQHLAFFLQILCCDYWGKLFMGLVFLSVKLFSEGVYWLFFEAWSLSFPLTYHRTFIASAFILMGQFLTFSFAEVTSKLLPFWNGANMTWCGHLSPASTPIYST